MNNYEQKIEAKKQRYAEMAKNLEKQSNEKCAESIALSKTMPFGQPILMGHHSESRHRNLIKRTDNAMRQSVELDKKAKYYEEKAQNYGSHGVSSDDDSAIAKLQASIDAIEQINEQNKAINKKCREAHTAAKKLGITDNVALFEFLSKQINSKEAMQELSRYYKWYGKYPTKIYSISRAEIKRLQSRIDEIKAIKNAGTIEHGFTHYVYRRDVEDNRAMFFFDGKPEPDVIKILKRRAFKWSPSRGAWVRKLSENTLYTCKLIHAELKQFYEANQ